MYYPTLNEIETSREWLDVFLGYNHNLRIGEGEFYDMTNMSGDNYPLLSPRCKRGIYVSETSKPQGLIAKDALCYVDNGKFYINKKPVENFELTVEYEDETKKVKPKLLVSMGSYVIILPDKKYYNTMDETDKGEIEAHYIGEEAAFYLSLADGSAITPHIGDTPPTEVNGAYWIDTSDTPHALKVYSSSTDMWTAIATTYVRIAADGIGVKFNVGDAVTISGITDESLQALNASTVIIGKDRDYIIVTGLIESGEGAVMQTTPIGVSRWMPDMDFVIESQNRLWGCRYGASYQGMKYDATAGGLVKAYGAYVNEIYCCKIGDFKNWQSYQGIASDSYAVTVGTDGYFTGGVTHLGYPIFFKENCMHKIYGNYPANYQVQTTACRGVQKGCDRSISIVNEVVYYKGRAGIMAYDGSLPMEVSGALGDKSYSDARAGYLGNKYYVSMKDEEGEYSLFVYDTKKGTWHREDATEAVVFCNCRGDLYYIDYADNQIKTVKGTGTPEPNPIKWEVVTGLIGTDTPDKKYISRLDVRMKLEVGAAVSFYAEYDSGGSWEHLFNMTGVNIKSFPVSIKPKRCDHLRLRVVGVGEAKIFSICKTVEWGSDK